MSQVDQITGEQSITRAWREIRHCTCRGVDGGKAGTLGIPVHLLLLGKFFVELSGEKHILTVSRDRNRRTRKKKKKKN